MFHLQKNEKYLTFFFKNKLSLTQKLITLTQNSTNDVKIRFLLILLTFLNFHLYKKL